MKPSQLRDLCGSVGRSRRSARARGGEGVLLLSPGQSKRGTAPSILRHVSCGKHGKKRRKKREIFKRKKKKGTKREREKKEMNEKKKQKKNDRKKEKQEQKIKNRKKRELLYRLIR